MTVIVIDAENSALLYSVDQEFVIMPRLLKRVLYPKLRIFIDIKLTVV